VGPDQSAPTPSRIAARRLKELRQRRGMSAQRLADRLEGAGVKLRRAAIAKIENGTRSIDLDEALALAWALDVGPLSFFLPPQEEDQDQLVTVAGTTTAPAWEVREWSQGLRPLLTQNGILYFSEEVGSFSTEMLKEMLSDLSRAGRRDRGTH
jgi:transcriptional regulator with XRE-family HTH domain